MYLPPHGKSEQYNPVEKEYWPKHRHIKYAEECQRKSYAESFCDGVPSTRKRMILRKPVKVLQCTAFQMISTIVA